MCKIIAQKFVGVFVNVEYFAVYVDRKCFLHDLRVLNITG